MSKRVAVFILVCLLGAAHGFHIQAQDLLVTMDDVRLVRDAESGYHLYIRKKADIASILITETTKDPEGREDNYAFRDPRWNPVNGDELRILDGEFLSPDSGLFSLTDSTPEDDEAFGRAFHIFIPPVMEYGYQWARSGTETIRKGLFINIRAFERPYTDYDGAFRDNPFVVDLLPASEAVEEPVLNDEFRAEVVESFSDIAKSGSGQILYSSGTDDIIDKIRRILEPADPEKKIDLILTIDATASMADDIKSIRSMLPSLLEELLSQYRSYRVGLVLYKDYNDDFWHKNLPVRMFPFTSNLSEFTRSLNSFRVSGGRDIPEAVYESLYSSLVFYEWDPDAIRRVILIGDAEPHPAPRGAGLYSKELIDSLISEKDAEVSVIVLMEKTSPN